MQFWVHNGFKFDCESWRSEFECIGLTTRHFACVFQFRVHCSWFLKLRKKRFGEADQIICEAAQIYASVIGDAGSHQSSVAWDTCVDHIAVPGYAALAVMIGCACEKKKGKDACVKHMCYFNLCAWTFVISQ